MKIKFERVTVSDIVNNPAHWRDCLYDQKILIFRGLPNLAPQEFVDVHKAFGRPWTAPLYSLSHEVPTKLKSGDVITTYNNVLMKESIGNGPMSFHRDIPWHRMIRYPIRSLYPTVLPQGKCPTLFLDADDVWDRVSPERAAELDRTELIIQSWYDYALKTGKEQRKRIPLVELHPHTKRKSLLLNAVGPTSWIRGVVRDGEELDGAEMTELTEIAKSSGVYEHDWALGDLVLFDNQSGIMHGRNEIPAEHRGFWRMNVKHYWQA